MSFHHVSDPPLFRGYDSFTYRDFPTPTILSIRKLTEDLSPICLAKHVMYMDMAKYLLLCELRQWVGKIKGKRPSNLCLKRLLPFRVWQWITL